MRPAGGVELYTGQGTLASLGDRCGPSGLPVWETISRREDTKIPPEGGLEVVDIVGMEASVNPCPLRSGHSTVCGFPVGEALAECLVLDTDLAGPGSAHHDSEAQFKVLFVPRRLPLESGHLLLDPAAFSEVSIPQVSHGRRSLDISDVSLQAVFHRCSSLACLVYEGSIPMFGEGVKGLSAPFILFRMPCGKGHRGC